MPNSHIEDTHQASIFQWAHLTRLITPAGNREPISNYLFAIPNGGKRDKREGGRLKAQGVTAGISDMMLALPFGGYHGLFIELKAPIVKGKAKPKTSPAQDVIIKRFTSVGYLCVVCWGYDEAIDIINKYIEEQL